MERILAPVVGRRRPAGIAHDRPGDAGDEHDAGDADEQLLGRAQAVVIVLRRRRRRRRLLLGRGLRDRAERVLLAERGGGRQQGGGEQDGEQEARGHGCGGG
jgi:hypothetical protein